MAQASRAGLIKTIHAGKRSLGMDDETYRAMLDDLTGATSCTALGLTDLKRVLYRMRQRGFRSTQPRNQLTLLQRKVFALWCELHTCGVVHSRSWDSMDAYVRRMCKGIGIKDAKPTDLSHVVESLKGWLTRAHEQEALHGGTAHQR